MKPSACISLGSLARYTLILTFGIVFWGNAFVSGLAFEEWGNRPFSDANYKEWPGIMPCVNNVNRVYFRWGNGDEILCFKGNTAALNGYLGDFAKVKINSHVVILKTGKGTTQSLQRKEIDYNWELHITGGIVRSHKINVEKIDPRELDPTITVFADGSSIQAENISLPRGVDLKR